MNQKTNSRALANGLGMILMSCFIQQTAQADTLIWGGQSPNGANWSDSLNWTNSANANVAPNNGDSLFFPWTFQTINSNDFAALTVGSITYSNASFDFVGNMLTISGGITNTASAGSDNAFDLPLTLGAAQTFEVDGGSLTFNKTITDGGNALTITGAGNVNLNGQMSGAGSLAMSGTGMLLITNRQPLTGGIVVNSGIVQFSTAGNLNFNGAESPSLITVNAGGTVYNTTTHSIGGGTPIFINGGIWELDHEDYKTNIVMTDGIIQTGPNPAANNGEVRVGFAGGTGTYTWYVTNSVAGSQINNPINTIGSTVNLILDVARGAAASDLTINGNIINSGNITVIRNGVTTLTGNNTQTGTFTIAGGTVVLQNSLLSSVITVASNGVFDISSTSFSLNNNQVLTGVGTVRGTLSDNNPGVTSGLTPGGNGVAGTLTMGGLALSGNGLQLNFDLANSTGIGGGTNDLLIVTNFSGTAGSTNIVNISFLNGTPTVGQAYTLIQYDNGFTGDPAQFMAAAASRYVYTFTNNQAANAIQVIVSGQPANLVWKGDGVINSWDVGVSTNWFNGAPNKDVFLAGDNVTFSDIGSNSPSINVASAVLPTTVTINSTKDYVFTGPGKISNGARFVKSNSGNLAILTADDNSGGGSYNGAGVVTVGNGSTVAANIGTGLLTNNTKVVFFENASPTYAGSMSGTGSLISFTPGGTLTLTGTNTFTGGLTVANGAVQIGNNTAGVSPSVAGNITNYGTLNIYRSDAFTNQNNITSAGNTLEYGNGDINVRGTGGMTVDGSGSINALPAGSLSIGQSASGMMTVNPGAAINVGLNFLIGNPNAAGNYGIITQNGGTISVGNQVRIGHWASEVSTYTMNGGVLNAPNNQVAVGWDGIGLMTMNGGTINCRALTVDDNGFTFGITNAFATNTSSVFTMNSGQLNIGVGGIGGNVQTNTDANDIRLSGGIIAATALAGFSSSMNLVLTNGSPTFDTTNVTVTLSGVLSGNGGLTKQGTGYLNLNGANTYANVTTVAAGTLQGSGTVVGPIVVQSGANLSAGGTLATGALTTSNLNFNTGASLVIDASSTSSNSDLVYVKGTLTLATNTPLTMNFLGGLPFTGNPYTIVSNLLPRAGSGNLVLAPSGLTRYAATVDQSNPNCIRVSYSGASASLVWQGGASTNWNVNTDSDWLNAGVPDKYYQSDVVLFDDSGISKSNVNVSAAMTPASVTVNSSGNYTFYGSPISGITTLTKTGSGTLTLLNNNAYTGVTTIGSGSVLVGNGTTLGQLPPAGTVDDYGSLVFNHSDTVTFNGTINGPGQLKQAGSGTLLIAATQNHYGGTTVNPGGTIQMGNGNLADAGSLGNGPVTNNGTITFFRASSIAVAAPYTGSGALNFLGTGNSGQSAYSLNATNTFTGPVTVSLARIQSGVGAQSFGSPSSITINPGSAVYATANVQSPVYNMPLTLAGTGWQDGLGALRMEGNGTWAGNITLAANARIAATSASTNTVSGTIGGNYELETSGNNAAGAIVLAPASANSYSALRVSIGTAGTKTIAGNNNAIPNNIPLTMNGGTLWLNGFSKTFSTFLNLNGSSSIQNGSSTARAIVTLSPVLGTSAYNGTFADGASQPLDVTFTQTPGQWTLNLPTGSPNWTGNLTNNGGTITIGGSTGVAYLGANGGNTLGRNIVGNNGAVFVTAINNTLNGYAGNVVLNNSTWLCNRYISMAPSAGYLYLANSTMTGTNSTDGNYETWSLPSTVVIRGTAPSYMLGGGTSSAFDVQSGGTTFDVADVTGNANSDLIVGGGSSTTFLHSPANTTSGGSLTKTGAGTLELDGANTYTGSTTINQGTVTLGAGASLKSGSISIASGATFDVSAISGGLPMAANQVIAGSGSVKGSVIDNSGTSLQPGGTGIAGTLTITANVTLNGSGSLAIDLSGNPGSGNDQIAVGGTLTLSSGTPTPVDFNFLAGVPATGTYTIMTAGTISGTAAGLTNSQGLPVTFNIVGNTVQATFSASPLRSLVWVGNDPLTPATWDVGVSTNWWDGAVTNIFSQFDSVRFDDTSSANAITLNTAVLSGAIVVDSTNNYTISGTGSIGGTNGITKNNTNTFTLSTVNMFTGPILVNAGKLALGVNDALPPRATVVVSNNAVFDFADFNGNTTTRGYSFVIGGAGPDGNGSMIDSVDGGGIYSYASVSNLTLTADSVIGGIERWDIGSDPNSKLDGQGHNLTIVGSGNGSIDLRSQIITNVASITISNPLTWYENFNQTNAWTANTTNYVAAGSTLGIYGAKVINMPLVLNGSTIQNQGGGSPAVWSGNIVVSNNSVFNNSGAQNFLGIISGPGAMSVNGGTAALTLSNLNTYAGGTVISNAPSTRATNGLAAAGTAAIVLANAGGLGSGPVTIAGTAYGSLSTNASFFNTNVLRALECNVANGGVIANGIVLPGNAITNVGIQGRDSSSVFTLSGQIGGGFTGLTNWFDSATAGSVGVTRLANNANNFIGNIYVPRGELAITGDGCLGNAANNLKLDQGVAAVATANGLRFDAPGITVAHNIFASSGTAFDLFGDNTGSGAPNTVNNATISGIISGSGTIYVRGTNGTLTLSGVNTCSGGFELQQPAILQVSASANLGTAYVAIKAGSTFRYTGTGSETMTRTLWSDGGGAAGGGTIDISSPTAVLTWNPGGGTANQGLTKTGAGTLIYGTQAISGGYLVVNNGAMTVNSAISGTFTPITVSGGTLTLAGANTCLGGVSISGGTLLVNGSLPVGNPLLASSGILGGSGVINSPVTIQSSGGLQPGGGGANVGRLTVNSTLNLAGTTTMYLNKAAATNSQVAGISVVTYGGTLNVNNLGGSFAGGDKFTLFSAGDHLGAFSSVNLPVLPSGMTWSNSLAVDGSIQVVATVNTNPTNITSSVSGNTLTLSWPSDHTGWRLQAQTNSAAAGLNPNAGAWFTVPGSTSVNTESFTMDPAQGTVFYRLVYP